MDSNRKQTYQAVKIPASFKIRALKVDDYSDRSKFNHRSQTKTNGGEYLRVEHVRVDQLFDHAITEAVTTAAYHSHRYGLGSKFPRGFSPKK